MITFIKNKIQKKDKGFTLLFAVLVSTLVISISATVISIALRQTIISGTSRESQYAFYATNTVVECAFYWDIVGVTGNPEGGPVFLAQGETRSDSFDSSDITCAGGNIVNGVGFNDAGFTGVWLDEGSESGVTTIFIQIKDNADLTGSDNNPVSNEYCAEATITKTKDGGTGIITTTIEAKGYNTCDLTSPRTVERGLIQSYQS